MRLQAEVRELPVVLTPEELEDRGAALAAAVRNADQEEAHMEGRKAAWREELKKLKEDLHVARTEASKLAEIVRTGRDKRDVNCTWKHAIQAGWRFLVRDDTGERVASVKLKDDERQMVIGEPPYAEPTPEELAEWLATLPVNEEQAPPEGHAGEVEPGDRAVDLQDASEFDRDLASDDEDLEAYDPDEVAERFHDAAEGDEDEDGDICGVTMDHQVNPATNECSRCGAELADDYLIDDLGEMDEDDEPALDTEEEILEQEIDDAIVADEFGEPLEEPISAGATTPQLAGQSVQPPRVGPGETLLREPAYVLRCSDCGAEEGEPFAGLDECPHCHIGRLLEMTPAEPAMPDAQAERLAKRGRKAAGVRVPGEEHSRRVDRIVNGEEF